MGRERGGGRERKREGGGREREREIERADPEREREERERVVNQIDGAWKAMRPSLDRQIHSSCCLTRIPQQQPFPAAVYTGHQLQV